MSRRTWAILAAALVASLPLLAQDKPAGDKPKESRTAYLRRIFEKDRASYGDACRAVLSVVKSEHSDADFASISDDLYRSGIARADWRLLEGSLLTKGTLAYMVCQALEIKGGLTMRLFGINRRYALRECIQRRLMLSGSVDEYVTGRELIDVITNATIHKEQGHTDSQYK
jgi:hypothetical protein